MDVCFVYGVARAIFDPLLYIASTFGTLIVYCVACPARLLDRQANFRRFLVGLRPGKFCFKFSKTWTWAKRKGCAGPCRLSGLLSCAAAERFDDGVANFEARFGVVATGLLAAEVVLALGA